MRDRTDLQRLDSVFEELRRRWGVRLRRATRESLGDGVGLRSFPLLEQLLEHGPLSPTDLAQRLELRTSTITAHVDRLEELGWAQRAAQGRKGVLVTATTEGRAAHQRYLTVRRKMMEELVAPLADEDVQDLTRLVELVLRAMQPEEGAR